MTRCKWLSLLLLLLSLSGTCWIASTSGVASSTPMMQRRKQSQMYKNFFFFFSNILLYFFQERERKREERLWGGMRKADLNKLVKAGHLTFFLFSVVFCHRAFLQLFGFSTFFFPFYFLTGGDWDVKIRQADSQWVAKTPHRRTRFAWPKFNRYPFLIKKKNIFWYQKHLLIILSHPKIIHSLIGR